MAGVAAVVAALYLSGGFVWDDRTLIAQELVTQDLSSLLELWVSPIRESGPGAAYYRPVSLTIMAVLARLGPWALHLLALVLHSASAVLLTRLVGGGRWPLLGGLVFALHPMASEVLAWCSAIPDALAVFLGLLSVYAWKRSPSAALFVLLLGCLSKETAALVPLTFGVAGMLGNRWWVRWGFLCLVVAGLRFGAGVVVSDAWMDKWAMAPDALAWSLGGLVWPFPLSAVRDLWVVPGHMYILGGALVLAMSWFGRNQKRALAGLGLVLAAPMIAVPVMLDGYLVAERYMYVGTVGLGLWCASVCRPISKSWWMVFPVLAALGVHGSRSSAWKDDVSLFSEAVRAHPTSSYSWHLLGISLAESGRFDGAADAFQKAVAQGHPHPLDRFLCLKALVLAGRAEDALLWAQSGPQEHLTADAIAWRARAALLAGKNDVANALLQALKTADGFDGPSWVGDLYEQVQTDISNPTTFSP